MVKSLYSGVAGLKSQQTKMDVIGNNIANVGTYGYKSSRATFKDVYYQTQTAATAATGSIGGTNAKQVGYGNTVSSIDTNTQTSAMSATGYNLDIAIAGEGFLQVMGMDGKIMYTKAGMLDIDAEGNLVDVNGNFILGSSGDVSGPPASDKINISLPFLDPSTSQVTEKINNVVYEISSSNATNKANVNFSFAASSSLPVGQKITAKVSGSSINVTVNSTEYFKDMEEFNSYLNQAIKDALGGTEHPAGTFTITSSDESMFKAPLSPIDPNTNAAKGLSGAEIVSNNFGYELGGAGYLAAEDSTKTVATDTTGVTLTTKQVSDAVKNLFSVKTVNSGFQGDTRTDPTKFDADGLKNDTEDSPAKFEITYGVNGIVITVTSDYSVNPVTHKDGGKAIYRAELSYDKLNAPGEVNLRRIDTLGAPAANGSPATPDVYSNDETDSMIVNYPELTSIKNVMQQLNLEGYKDIAAIDAYRSNPAGSTLTKQEVTLNFGNILKLRHSEPTRSLGLGQKSFTLTGGTEGGEQTVANLTAISINPDGIIVGVHDVYGVCELGRVDLATFANPAGLTKVGSTYFEESLNSGDPIIVNAGTEGTGEIMASTLESSNVDLSSEFSDMIMTQRGFQASSRVITVSDTMLEELINLKR